MPKAFTHVLVSVRALVLALTATNILKHVYSVRQCKVFEGGRCVGQFLCTVPDSICNRKKIKLGMFVLEKAKSILLKWSEKLNC